MGGRKKHVKVQRKVRRIPVKFDCPNCGARTMNVEIDRKSDTATIRCSKCGLAENYKISSIEEPVDIYGKLMDEFYQEATYEKPEKSVVKKSEKERSPRKERTEKKERSSSSTRTDWTIELVKQEMARFGISGVDEVNEDNMMDYAKKVRRSRRKEKASS